MQGRLGGEALAVPAVAWAARAAVPTTVGAGRQQLSTSDLTSGTGGCGRGAAVGTDLAPEAQRAGGAGRGGATTSPVPGAGSGGASSRRALCALSGAEAETEETAPEAGALPVLRRPDGVVFVGPSLNAALRS